MVKWPVFSCIFFYFFYEDVSGGGANKGGDKRGWEDMVMCV